MLKLKILPYRMLSIAKYYQSSSSSAEDYVQKTKRVLLDYPGSSFLWLVTDERSVLIPLRLGVDPMYLPANNKSMTLFHIHSDGEIEKVSYSCAEELIAATPNRDLSSLSSEFEVFAAVKASLVEGVVKGVWRESLAIEETGSWVLLQWREYFISEKNSLMVGFLDEGIRLINSLSIKST